MIINRTCLSQKVYSKSILGFFKTQDPNELHQNKRQDDSKMLIPFYLQILSPHTPPLPSSLPIGAL
jgi:hypothetical protein